MICPSCGSPAALHLEGGLMLCESCGEEWRPCVACGGTTLNSYGGPCRPCQIRAANTKGGTKPPMSATSFVSDEGQKPAPLPGSQEL